MRTRADEVELVGSAKPSPGNRRVTLPLFGGDGPSVAITNAELEQAMADEDAAAGRPLPLRGSRKKRNTAE